MCIHRMFYDEGVEGDKQFVKALADSKNDPYYNAAARLFQNEIDIGNPITDATQDRVWSETAKAEKNGTLEQVGVAA